MCTLKRIVVVAAVALLGCQAKIQHGLDERQANEILSVLIERGFDAKKVPEAGKKPAWAIEVPDGQATDAVRILAELGLPRPKVPTTMDVLGTGGLVPTPTEERQRQVVGLAGDIAATLETVDGVTSARVHLVLPPPARPGQPQGQAKAAAFLRVRPGAADRVNMARDQLRALVAGSVEGLSPENVTLVVNEVATSVVSPPPQTSREGRLRILAFGLGVATSVLALAVLLLTIRMRQYRARAQAPKPAAPPSKPVVAPGVARKVA